MNMIAKTALLASVFVASYVNASQIVMNEVNFDVQIICPMSQELLNLRATPIPLKGQPISYEEWAGSFIANMEKIIELVKSQNVRDGTFAISIKEAD
ncbi:MAG TPA: hypothetical protein VHK67_00700 [Rhabdochlamydiaceae bacterium]|jgi:hypothetical protein|nr:hypothetical protein [Rhabdochlamydiaceae bacterium]